MTAKELAEILLRAPDAEVTAWDADFGCRAPVTGAITHPMQDRIDLHTDDIN